MLKEKKPLGHRIWFKIILTLCFFVPCYSQVQYSPAETTAVIASVMAHPIINSVTWLLPLTKASLLVAVVFSVFAIFNKKTLVFYYAFILLIIGAFQNMAFTNHYGFVWVVGNTIVEYIIGAFCIYYAIKGKVEIDQQYLNKKRLWLVPLMLLAFLMPYAISTQNTVLPAFSQAVLYNEAGVTYCMITPVVLGILILYSKGIDTSFLSIASYVGFVFGLSNMTIWFGIQSENWWMGVLHLPLLIISFTGLLVAHKEYKTICR